MYLNNGNIKVLIDEKNGTTAGIFDPNDDFEMNWVLENSNWGSVLGFETKKADVGENKAVLHCEKGELRLTVEKEVTKEGYFETYFLHNSGDTEYFLTKENFGIEYPYQCNYSQKNDLLDKTCISHIWCGGDVCYICSKKLCGKPPFLVMKVLEGSFDDYGINYDVTRANIGSYYRGAFVLHPKQQIILPNGTVKYQFFYKFEDKADFSALGKGISFSADKYTAHLNEKINLKLECKNEPKNVRIYCGDKEIEYKKTKNTICASVCFEALGEQKIVAEVDEQNTFMYINIIMPLKEILEKRVDFIVRNQQYLQSGSHLDGAYLIYDGETKQMYCDSFDFTDHNAARERIGMGVLVCKALQLKYNEEVMKSLEKHREFIERELFDSKTGFVFNDIKRNDKMKRIFNFPWLSTYYLEWYNLTGEKKYLENSAKILMNFFELAEYKYPAQCIEAVTICEALEKEDMQNESGELKKTFLRYVENMSTETGIINECSWCSEIPCCWVAYQSQAYILTKDPKYLKSAETSFLALNAFWGKQPDFRLNCVPVRYWDRYWFGKHKSYGDVFPHYWSVLAAWAMNWHSKALAGDPHRKEIEANLSGNLCVYDKSGFAANNYLYPYKITLYSPDPNHKNPFMKPGTVYGKNYDAWANDQDWALYYAVLCTKEL